MKEKANVHALGAFARAQKEENRRRLIEAAGRVFERSGYMLPSVDDIAQEAGVSRQTFYRHFDGKLGVALEYFNGQRSRSLPLWCSLDAAAARDRSAAEDWITRLLDNFRERRNGVRIFVEMSVAEPSFLFEARSVVPEIIRGLAQQIPAFRFAMGESEEARRCWMDAWLLIYQTVEQCSNVALNFPGVDRTLLTKALAGAMVDFVKKYDPD